MVMVAPGAIVNTALSAHVGPTPTHTTRERVTEAAAQLMAAWMVRNGRAGVPSAVVSSPVVTTGTQPGQSSSTRPSQSWSPPPHPSVVAGGPVVQVPTLPATQAATVRVQVPRPQVKVP